MEPLTLEGYRRIFRVLDKCCSATSIMELRDLLLPALAVAFKVRHTTMFVGANLAGALADQGTVDAPGPRAHHILDEYHNRWQESDVFATPDSQRFLNRTGAVGLSELRALPDEARDYVRHFLVPHGLLGSAAMRLSLAGNGVALVGLFDPDPSRVGPGTVNELRLLARQVSAPARLLPLDRPLSSVIDRLAARQLKIARLVSEGLTNADIAGRLNLTEDTVKKYVSQALAATGCRSRTELALQIAAETR